jgi:ABC-type iron transport system FetAB ATPase subunit
MLTVAQLRFLHFGPFDFEVAAGTCVGLAGPSGAGKTRMLRSLADLDPHQGVVTLNGKDASSLPAPAWRRGVGYLPAESRWWADHVGPHFGPAAGAPAAVIPFEELGFGDDVLSWPVARLSSGEQQRLALLRLLQYRPRALLLDEPTNNLDEGNGAQVESLVKAYRKRERAMVLWVSHDAAQLRRVAARVLRLEEGRLESGP